MSHAIAGLPSTSGVRAAPSPFELRFGGSAAGRPLGYTLHGDSDRPVVVVLGGISAHRHVVSAHEPAGTGWWDSVVREGGGIDLDRYRVLGFDYLGGNGATFGPHHLIDAAGYPRIDTHDQARAIAAVLDALGVERVLGVVGASYGGMVALAFASLFGERVGGAVLIGAAHRAHPAATAYRSVQRRIVRFALEHGSPDEGLRIARALGVVTYRTPEELAARFDGPPTWTGDELRFPVESYLAHQGARFAARFSPWSYLRLSESLDLHRVDPRTIHVPVTLVSVASDGLVPPAQTAELRNALAGPAELVTLRSAYGHDAFLKEPVAISSIVRTALDSFGRRSS